MYKEREREMDAISVLAIGKDLLHQRLGTYQVSLCTRCTQDMEFSQALSFTSSEYMCFYVLMYGMLDHGLSTALHDFIYSRVVLLSLWNFILGVQVMEKFL